MIAEKVQAEMDEVVGKERTPSMKDRGSLPFTEATIMEVERMTVAVPLGIPHMASETGGKCQHLHLLLLPFVKVIYVLYAIVWIQG